MMNDNTTTSNAAPKKSKAGMMNDNATTSNAVPRKSKAGTKGKVATRTKTTSKGKSKELNPPIPSRTDYGNGAAQIAFCVDGMISINIFTLTLILIFVSSYYSRS